MIKILALDTATEACSAALWVDGSLTHCDEVAPQAHTRKILPMCQSLLQGANLELSHLDAIAFGRGPGSFTGVRIGIGVAQGLAFGVDKPLIAVSNLAILAQGAHRRLGASHVLCAIDARMNEVYFGAFSLQDGVMMPLLDEAVLAPEAALQQATALLDELVDERWAAIGTGFQAYASLLDPLQERVILDTEQLPWAQDMLPLALNCWQNGDYQAAELATPTYLRDKVTWKKLPGRE